MTPAPLLEVKLVWMTDKNRVLNEAWADYLRHIKESRLLYKESEKHGGYTDQGLVVGDRLTVNDLRLASRSTQLLAEARAMEAVALKLWAAAIWAERGDIGVRWLRNERWAMECTLETGEVFTNPERGNDASDPHAKITATCLHWTD